MHRTILSLLLILLALGSVACESKSESSDKANEGEPSAEGAQSPEGAEAGEEPGEAAPVAAETDESEAAPAAGSGADTATAGLVEQPGAAIGDRTLCPIMEGEFEVTADSPVVEHEGKKVFFCCGGCDTKFAEDPEAYLETHRDQIAAANAE